MILDFNTIILLPAFLYLLGIMACSVFYAVKFRHRKPDHRPNIYRCQTCSRVYEDLRKVPLSRCHGCGTLNESVRR